MDEEKRIIRLIDEIIPRAGRSYESDSEIFTLGKMTMLFSMDEFSKEDNFRESDPKVLGANLATGSISDILASGGVPLFYAHAMSVCNNWDDDFIRNFSRGIAEVLDRAHITFLGGDLGKSQSWHYTAAVIGRAVHNPVLRTGARAGDGIYITGKIGAGNLEAALVLYEEKYSKNPVARNIIKSMTNKFVLRLNESDIIREYGGCCIDTSDGVFNALNEIAEKNNTGYRIKNLPYIKTGKMLSKILSLPVELLFICECGEYELLFTVHPEDEKDFLAKVGKKKYSFFKIGTVTKSSKRILEEKGRIRDLTHLNIRARDYAGARDYIEAMVQWLKEKDGE